MLSVALYTALNGMMIDKAKLEMMRKGKLVT
jgi:hypothetical protein